MAHHDTRFVSFVSVCASCLCSSEHAVSPTLANNMSVWLPEPQVFYLSISDTNQTRHSLFVCVVLYMQWIPGRLKPIVMISLNIRVTSQQHLCVQCVTNGFQVNLAIQITEKNTLDKTSVHAASVGNILYLSKRWVDTWTFMQKNTNAQNVANVVTVVVH